MEYVKKLLKDWYGFIGVSVTEEELEAAASETPDEQGRVIDPLENMSRSLVELGEDFGMVIVDDFISYVKKRHTGPEEAEFTAWAADVICGYTDPNESGRAYRTSFGFGDMGQSNNFMARLMMDQQRGMDE